MPITDLSRQIDRFAGFFDRSLFLTLRKVAPRQVAHRLRTVPLMVALFSKCDGLVQIIFGEIEISPQNIEFAQRVVDTGNVDIVLLSCDLECPFDHLLGLSEFADQHQINAEIVIGDHGVKSVLGLIKKLDRFLEARYAVLRTPEKPVCTGHIRI